MTTITDLDDFKALDPFFRIIEKGLDWKTGFHQGMHRLHFRGAQDTCDPRSHAAFGAATSVGMGRYWARTSDPQLVDSRRPFAPVRACSPNPHGSPESGGGVRAAANASERQV
jgi:hypothetical protein